MIHHFLVYQGKYDEARELFERSVPMLEKTLGPHHSTVAQTLEDLAAVFRAQVRTGRFS